MSTSFLYYPGCSMGGTAMAYAESLEAVAGPLGIELHEIDDWNCCGASEYLSIGPLRGYALVSRNLALAERQRNGSRTLVAPCSLCYVNLAKTDQLPARRPGPAGEGQRGARRPAASATTRGRSRCATCSRSSSTTSAATRCASRSSGRCPACGSRPTSAAW